MASKILLRNRRFHAASILNEAYHVDLCEDAPLFELFPQKSLVILHAGKRPMQISVETEASHATMQLHPKAICALPMSPSLCVHWTGASDLLLLSMDRNRLCEFAMEHGCTGIEWSWTYVLQSTPANLLAGFLIEELLRDRLMHTAMGTTLKTFLLHLLRHCNRKTWVRPEPAVYTSDLQKVIPYIRENLAENLLVDDLAARTGLHRHQFFRVFRKATGLNPHQWILRARLQEAAKLLHEPTLTIAQIADVTGFADQSHLTRKFRRLYKCTPHQYRLLEDDRQQDSISE